MWTEALLCSIQILRVTVSNVNSLFFYKECFVSVADGFYFRMMTLVSDSVPLA